MLLLPSPFCPHQYRHQAAYPHVAKIYSQAIPTIITLFLMTIASTWLLLHAASQWARTRSEAKLLHRIPHAAKHALAVQQQQHKGGSSSPGSSFPGGHSKGGEGDAVKSGGGRLSNGRGVSSSSGGGSGGEATAPLAEVADVPLKQQPAPLASV